MRGTCRAGHTTEATSDPGRVTWEGPCSHPGCDLKVRGRRVPADTPAPPADTRTAAAGDGDPYQVREVSYAAQHPARAAGARPDADPGGRQQRGAARAAAAAEGGPAGVPPAGHPPAGGPGFTAPTGERAAGQPRDRDGRWASSRLRSWRERAGQRRTERAAAEAEWVVPGVLRH